MPPALIKRCPREPFSKPESKELAYGLCTLTYISPEASQERGQLSCPQGGLWAQTLAKR